MSFSFIKMFFFLSLAIVFLFILLLCYYLKNKIEVVERRLSSQTDVLGKLIREFKLQACFGYGGGNEANNRIQATRLEPVLEEDDGSDSDSDSSSSYEEDEDDNSVGMEKVKDDDLLDNDTAVKNTEKEDEYKGLDFEKVADEEPVVEFYTGEEDCLDTVQVSPEETEEDELPELIKEPEEEDETETPIELDGTKAEPKEPVFDDEKTQEKERKIDEYSKMSLVQLKHVAQHTFHLSTTQIAKMKKDELLKWVLAQS